MLVLLVAAALLTGCGPETLGGVLGLDPPSPALDANAVIRAFFSARPKAG